MTSHIDFLGYYFQLEIKKYSRFCLFIYLILSVDPWTLFELILPTIPCTREEEFCDCKPADVFSVIKCKNLNVALTKVFILIIVVI